MTKITLNLTLEELKQIDKFVELNVETQTLFDKIRKAYPEPETLLDVIRNLGYSYDMCYEIVDAVEKFEKSKEYQPTPQELKENELVERLKKNPPEFLKFKLGQSLTDLIEDWWADVFTTSEEMEVCIDSLVEQIKHWLPKEQSACGSQRIEVECAVDGFNDCLTKIKSKLR